MELFEVTAIAQVDGCVRHLLCADRDTAVRWRAAIAADPVMVDSGSPDYVVDHYPGGRNVEATVFPGRHVTAKEWRAIHRALMASGGLEA